MELDVEFCKLWRDMDLSGRPNDTYRWLHDQYEHTGRHYHKLSHIEYGLKNIDLLCGQSEMKENVKQMIKFAFWFHDSEKDEAISAKVASFVLATNRKSDLCDQVSNLILLTKHDRVPQSFSERIMVDADLAILASEPKVFDNYENNIRKEYEQYSDKDFARGRFKILTQFLKRDSIYYTIFARREWNHKARANLLRSVKELVKVIE